MWLCRWAGLATEVHGGWNRTFVLLTCSGLLPPGGRDLASNFHKGLVGVLVGVVERKTQLFFYTFYSQYF